MRRVGDMNGKLAAEAKRLALGGLGDALVMIVDDEPLVIELTQAFLEDAGYRRFVTTSDSSKALGIVRQARPDIVLLDLNMPRVSGFDVLTAMRDDGALKHIPVIVLTSADDAESKLRALDLGASDYLGKPVHPGELALRVRNTLAAKAHRETLRNTLVRYVSPRLADSLISEAGAPFGAQAQRTDAVALFADLRRFTRITETLEVEDVVEMLNAYFAALTEAAYRYDGTIFNMAGDGLLVGFNVPFAQADAAARAWRAAAEMQTRVAELAADWTKRHKISTGVGIGICRGPAIVGNIGSPHYMSYTMIGDAVNSAARLMQMAETGDVLVSGSYYESVRELLAGRRVQPLGAVTLRGRAAPVEVYSIRP